MEYERIEKPLHQGGGFSPKKLRAMLLGVEKRRKEEEEIESQFSLRPGSDATRGPIIEECTDVDMVSSISDPSSSSEPDPLTNIHKTRRDADHQSRALKPQEDDSFDSESVASNFEFHKDIRNPNPNPGRSPAVAPSFSKPSSSKWADAQKWIASPNSNRVGRSNKKQDRVVGLALKDPVTKVVREPVMDDAETKRVDYMSQEKRDIVALNTRPVNWVPDPYPEVDSYPKPVPVIVSGSAVNLSCHGTSVAVQSETEFISLPSTVRSVSMRDMGTEMTPIASQEPSRTGTPIRAASPNPSSPTSPRRCLTGLNLNTLSEGEMSEKDMKLKTRREIMMLGTQLGKSSIAAWASKQEEDKQEKLSFNNTTQTGPICQKNAIETRAIAWEEAEKAKYIARFKREEIKIQAWEDHQKAKIEAEMRKIEVEVERMRAHAQDQLMNKLASTRHKAEEKRAAAEARRSHAAARTAEHAQYIRETGRIPSTFSCTCWGLCF